MAGGMTGRNLAAVGGAVLALIAGGTILQLAFARFRAFGFEPSLPLEHSAVACVATLAVLAAAGMPAVQQSFGHDNARRIAAVQVDPISADEARRRMEGYYEDLASVNLQSTPLISEAERAAGPRSEYFDALRERNDILEKELIPGWTGEVEGQPFQVNRWGMRDDDLPRRKRPGHYRVAFIGSSVTMGYGVAEDADFETIVEKRVNAEIGEAGPRVEFLNFAEGNYDALHAAGILREKALPFDLDAAFIVADQSEVYSPKRLADASYLKYPLPYPCLNDVLRKAGVTDETSWGTTGILLQKRVPEVVACTYKGIVSDCRKRGVTPVWIFLPMPGFDQFPASLGELLKNMAREAGFVVIDLSNWEEGHSNDEVMLDMYHPNALGHRLIAARLFEALAKQPAALPPLSERATMSGPASQ
jgi:hypothetical protein